MRYSPAQYAKALYELVEADPKNMKATVASFAKMLASHQKLKLLRAISEEFKREWFKRKNITPVIVESAEKSAVKVEELIKLIGGQIEVTEKTNPSVLGGVRITVGDTRIENTVERRMQELKNAVLKF